MSSAMMIDEDEAKELESGDDFIHVMVTDPHKVGDGMSSFIGEYSYSCDEITTTWIQISNQNWNGFS